MAVARILIAGVHSGVGKTTIATGIMAALTKRGLKVQGFKVGPDYIDPSYHTLATGRVSRNLDTWLLGEDGVRELFRRNTRDADIAVIEGVMGLFDGEPGKLDRGSSAHIARILKSPVVLVVDIRSMARSAAAVVHGYSTLDPEVDVAGVIANMGGSHEHCLMVKEAVEEVAGKRVLGCLRRDDHLAMPERHLGLVPVPECEDMAGGLTYLAQQIEALIDLDGLLEISRERAEEVPSQDTVFMARPPAANVRVAVARDEAFTFYYQDGLDLLASMGAELVPFSPLHDRRLPPGVSGIIIGGGFPELFLEQLSGNQDLMADLKRAADDGMPVYAECGGLMYLCRTVTDFAGKEYPLAGLVPAACEMDKRLAGIGYVEAVALEDNILCRRGETLRGHEFHYSRLRATGPEHRWAFKMGGKCEGFVSKNILASYVHLHFAGNPRAASRFISRCDSWKSGC